MYVVATLLMRYDRATSQLHNELSSIEYVVMLYRALRTSKDPSKTHLQVPEVNQPAPALNSGGEGVGNL